MSENITDEKENLRNRQLCIQQINQIYFQEIMTPKWYMTIDTIFNQYTLSEELMILLFKYCYERNALNHNYVLAVAKTWYSNNIKNVENLEEFLKKNKKKTATEHIVEKIIKNMLKINMNIETISKVTEVSTEEINTIRNEMS